MTSLPSHLDAAPPPLPPGAQKLDAQPSWSRGLRGIWLFTWRPQLVWHRIPVHLLGLLLLPALVYLTIPSPAGWAERHSHFSNAGQTVNELARRLVRSGQPLRPEQRSQLFQIFSEEFSRLDRSPAQTLSGDAGVTARMDELKASYERIQARAQTVLDENQLAPFQAFKKRQLLLGQGRIQPIWGRTEPFYHWLLDFYFFVILPLQCVRASGGLIRDELQADTLGFLLTRPLSRARLLLLKYATQTAWLEIVLLLETLLLFGVAAFRQLPGLGSLLPLLLAAQVLAVPAWSALGVFLGQVTKRYMPLALLYGLIVEMGIGRIPTNINSLSLIRHLKSFLAHLSALQDVYKWVPESVLTSLGALLFAACLFVTLAALLFTFREYHQTAEMQK